jgi:hypothetical protein
MTDEAPDLEVEGLFRLVPTYNGLALIAPSGSTVSVYWPHERREAEQLRDRLNVRAQGL